MDKKTLFAINFYEKEDFIDQSEIDKLCDSIDRKSLIDYDYIEGNAKTSIGVSQNQFLDFHKDLEERIVKEIPIKNQRMAESWCTIQKEDSTLKWHNHPNSVFSGILYLLLILPNNLRLNIAIFLLSSVYSSMCKSN